jgi:hypothetical protein
MRQNNFIFYRFFGVLVFVIFLCFSPHTPALNAQEEDERLKEYVEVINVEVVVRALEKDQLVSGLNQTDFTLYENGKKQAITSFMEIKRKIGVEETRDPKEEAPFVPQPKRLFFLYFRVSEPESQYGEALDYFFEQVYRPGDYVLIMVKNQVFKMTRKQDISHILPQVKTRITETARQAKRESSRMVEKAGALFLDFEKNFMLAERQRPGQNRPVEYRKKVFLDRLREDYRALWEEYKYKHIYLNREQLKAIASSLKTLKLQKWGLVFYQQDTFPQFDPQGVFFERHQSLGSLLELRKTFDKFAREMKEPTITMPVIKEIQQAFIAANATFHLFLFEKNSLGEPARYLKMDYVHSDWQTAFRNISRATGGQTIAEDDLKGSLQQAVEKEDTYYRLTYAPKITDDSNRVRNIKVKARRKRLNLQYNRQVTIQKANEIIIDNFSFSPGDSIMEFTLDHYQQLFDGYQLYGDIEVTVTAVDSKGEKLTFVKAFEPVEIEMNTSFKLNFPHPGKYNLIVEAFDKQTGRTAVFSEKIDVAEPAFKGPVLITPVYEKAPGIDRYGKKKQKAILDKAARYCEKLKKITFYFTCKEEIVESSIVKEKEVRNDSFVYDYQILLEKDGKMNERRALVENRAYRGRNGKSKQEKKKEKEIRELVITKFFSRYPFLMPATLLDRENQKYYRYQLLAVEKVKNRQAFKISVEPKKERSTPINHGLVWVDAVDGSVVKIELNPRALRGIDWLRKEARRKRVRLKVTDIHWYDFRKSGVRFPSRTEIKEESLAGQKVAKASQASGVVEKTKTTFSYSNYRFFKVNVNVLDAGHK